jgi:hypothetical protein
MCMEATFDYALCEIGQDDIGNQPTAFEREIHRIKEECKDDD